MWGHVLNHIFKSELDGVQIGSRASDCRLGGLCSGLVVTIGNGCIISVLLIGSKHFVDVIVNAGVELAESNSSEQFSDHSDRGCRIGNVETDKNLLAVLVEVESISEMLGALQFACSKGVGSGVRIRRFDSEFEFR